MKRVIVYTKITMVMLVLALSACTTDERVEPNGHNKNAVLTLAMPTPELVNVRSTAADYECVVNSLVLLAYRGASTTPVYGKSYNYNDIDDVLFGNMTNAPKLAFTTEYIPQDGDCLYLFINPYKDISLTLDKNTIDTLTWTLDSAIDDIPMYGCVSSWNGMIDNVCVITRDVAKVGVDVSVVSSPGMPFSGANITYSVVNANSLIYLSADAGLTDTEYNELPQMTFSWESVYIPEYKNSNFAKGSEVTPAITFNADRCCVLLHVENASYYDGFYRLDFHTNIWYDYGHTNDPSEFHQEEFFDILRNHNYVFRIKRVGSRGYRTQAEALANPGSNIQYELAVSDSENASVSNGQYAISCTNDDCIIYGSADETYTIASVKAVCGENMSINNIITNSISCDTGIEECNLSSLTTSEEELRVKLNSDQGIVTIRLGNLEKTITVRRESGLVDAHPVVINIPGKLDAFTVLERTMSSEIKAYDDGYGMYRLCIPDNVVPSNLAAMNADDVDPEFTEKYAVCLVNTLESDSNTGKVTRIIVYQGTPEYIGWFGHRGDLNSDGTTAYYSKRLLMESVEEEIGMSLLVGASAAPSLAEVANIPLEMENGRANTLRMASPEYQAAYYCYMKNDRNGNGIVDPEEPIDWYLPAHKQLMAITVCMENIHSKDNMINNIYRASNRVVAMFPGISGPNLGFGAWMYYGVIAYLDIGGSTYEGRNICVRCVRDL